MKKHTFEKRVETGGGAGGGRGGVAKLSWKPFSIITQSRRLLICARYGQYYVIRI